MKVTSQPQLAEEANSNYPELLNQFGRNQVPRVEKFSEDRARFLRTLYFTFIAS